MKTKSKKTHPLAAAQPGNPAASTRIVTGQDARQNELDDAALLTKCAELQSEVWQCLSKLEERLGIEIESTSDLTDTTIEHLLEESKERLA